ncbi:MAG: hypothetical protein K8L97_06340 [Anaerolineae bacterium]|nr:hypothetical protein [Anaerolineae bacterium]
MGDVFSDLLNLVNETLTAAIVVLSASLLLYNLTRNLRNRVARTSASVLVCVTVVYICDVLVSLNPSSGTLEAIVRMQWLGIAFMPAAMFHLSDALLATTGLPSRGRRRRVSRMLYLIGAAFVVFAAFSDFLIRPIVLNSRLINIYGGALFLVYVINFGIAVGTAFINVQRARGRCLTRDTRRRMGYLQFAMLTPAFGIFPYSVLLGLSETGSLGMLMLVNISNLVIVLMLSFLAYPLSFFGSRQPDRVVKTDLLRFMLRGPATGLLALAVIIFITPAQRILGLPGNSFMPFAVVAVVLLWQWTVALSLPWLEKKLIYSGEDDDQLAKLQNLSERLLTRTDLLQLLDAILSSTCDYLQVNTAFVVSLTEGTPELVVAVGPTRPNPVWLEEESSALNKLLHLNEPGTNPPLDKWHSYWIAPLYSKRSSQDDERLIIGFLGIQARANEVDLSPDEWPVFRGQIRRAAETLDDMTLQSEIYAALEGLLPQIKITRTRAAAVEYRSGREGQPTAENGDFDREQFVEQVRAALRHYWGGPGLSSSELLGLNSVHETLPETDNNPVRALRVLLQRAIEKQRPAGDRKLLSPEWTIYNILAERFIDKHKVRDVAIKLALSEPDLYRKQRIAIEAVADTLLEMEHQASQSSPR